MKLISLTQRQYAQVDDEDFEKLNSFKWCAWWNPRAKCFVPVRIKNRRTIYLYRYLLNCPKGMEVDHIDGNPLNNQKSNLRICTHSQNNYNRGKNKTSSNKFKGVREHGAGFMARLKYQGQTKYLGTFETPEDAARAYDEEAIKVFGEFARLNFPPNLSDDYFELKSHSEGW